MSQSLIFWFAHRADVYEDEYGVSSRPPAANISVGKWTQEEQAKLDRLLIEYPDEGVAQARWEKIASALGTRTAKQVGQYIILRFILSLVVN